MAKKGDLCTCLNDVVHFAGALYRCLPHLCAAWNVAFMFRYTYVYNIHISPEAIIDMYTKPAYVYGCLRLLNDDTINLHKECRRMRNAERERVTDLEIEIVAQRTAGAFHLAKAPFGVLFVSSFFWLRLCDWLSEHLCANNCFRIHTKWKFDNSLSVMVAHS